MLVVTPPKRVPLLLRPAMFLAEKLTGKEALPGRLLAHFPKGAVGAGVLEAAAAGPSDLEAPDGARVLAVARITASAVAGCPFCVDMNAATWKRAGLTPDELQALLARDEEATARLEPRAATAAAYATALSSTPVVLAEALVARLRAHFSAHEIVVLAATIASVNFWSRFNQGLGVPAAGFFDERACAVEGGTAHAEPEP
jgi:AhpD family alkylhydroperoxidase